MPVLASAGEEKENAETRQGAVLQFHLRERERGRERGKNRDRPFPRKFIQSTVNYHPFQNHCTHEINIFELFRGL